MDAHLFSILTSHHRIVARAFSYTTEHTSPCPFYIISPDVRKGTGQKGNKRKKNKLRTLTSHSSGAARQFRTRAHTNHRNYYVRAAHVCAYMWLYTCVLLPTAICFIHVVHQLSYYIGSTLQNVYSQQIIQPNDVQNARGA